MKPTAAGRILFWHGSSLWIGYAGEPTDLHAHHAVQIALPFHKGRVSFCRPSEDWVSYEAAVVAADEIHAFEARSQFMAQIFVAPESLHGRALQERYPGGIAALPLGPLLDDVDALAAAYEKVATDAQLIAIAQRTISAIAGVTDSAVPLDPRILKALQLIRARLDQPLGVAAVAAHVNLSPERFRHLFAAETGVGFRPYVLWLRLEIALATYVRGSSLTEAALTAGFADSPHFSRTFRRMFGIAPASVRPDQPFRSSRGVLR